MIVEFGEDGVDVVLGLEFAGGESGGVGGFGEREGVGEGAG